MCKKALNINKSIEWGLQVICVISVIVFVVIALAMFLLFHFIIFPYFFLEKHCPACDEDCPVAACEEVQEQGMWLYTFEKKKKDWERVKKRGVISLTHEREKREYRVGIYIVEIH